MRSVALAVVVLVCQESVIVAVALVDSLNSWVQLLLTSAGAAAALGAGWRWLIGPFYRSTRATFEWVREHLELISRLDERLDGIDRQLDAGEEHFKRLDEMLGVLSDENVREAKAAIRDQRPMRLTDTGRVERRHDHL